MQNQVFVHFAPHNMSFLSSFYLRKYVHTCTHLHTFPFAQTHTVIINMIVVVICKFYMELSPGSLDLRKCWSKYNECEMWAYKIYYIFCTDVIYLLICIWVSSFYSENLKITMERKGFAIYTHGISCYNVQIVVFSVIIMDKKDARKFLYNATRQDMQKFNLSYLKTF